MRVVPDTSVLAASRLSELIEEGRFRDVEVIIANVAVAELEKLANQGKEAGFCGIEELKRLKELESRGLIKLRFSGLKVSEEHIRAARRGSIDALIREIAKQEGAKLITCDFVQAKVAEALGLDVEYLEPKKLEFEPPFLKYMDETTLSLHLKENTYPYAKKGRPGAFELVRVSQRKLSREELMEMARKIVEIARSDEESFVEIDMKGATVVQLRQFRVSIARPPFSDGWEITVVRPLAKVRLEDYGLGKELMRRLETSAEGIIVAGPPGAGKSTFVQSLAEFYAMRGKVVKTMESPRDLQVPEEVTQYAPLEGSFEKTSDILLLVRPDFTIFDEMRKTSDFKVYTDMRLAGVGMVGVVHASRPIDAIQRFIGRVELGMLPHIVDTVIFIKDGEIKRVFTLSTVVKVPFGFREKELARPVIEVKDFETGEVVYEIYKFGEETVVMKLPVKERRKPRALEELRPRFPVRVEETKKYWLLHVGKAFRGDRVEIWARNSEEILITEKKVKGDGYVWIEKRSRIGKKIGRLLALGYRLFAAYSVRQ